MRPWFIAIPPGLSDRRCRDIATALSPSFHFGIGAIAGCHQRRSRHLKADHLRLSGHARAPSSVGRLYAEPW